MPNPHFDISITQRSKGKSAVAGAAYQSGEKLFSEYDQKMKDYTRKKGIVYTEIMLPANAPPEYADRQVLWNSAEEAEKQWNSQLARRFVLTFPREVPLEHYPQMVQEYCMEHFVSKGMCCDFAIHDPDPPRHNSHCHVMLIMRAMDEHGKWLAKSRKVYDLDENGEKIRLPSGNWKSHKEDRVDWNEQYHGEEWRHGWEVVQNRYLEMVGSPERVDLRSYERQGLDILPTVHMGVSVTQMEKRGIQTNIGNLNRDIKAANRMIAAIRSTISSLRRYAAMLWGDELHFLLNQCPFFPCYIEFDLSFSFASVHAIAPFRSEGLRHFSTSNFKSTHRRAGGRKYGKGYSFPMLATKLYPLLPTTPGTANLTNFPKRKTPQSATLQSLYINKNERTLFPRFFVVGFLYSFGSSRQNFQIFFAHTVKQGYKLI